MNRVCIIGCPGAGKSTLSFKIAEKTGLPLYHLDQMFWRPGWVEADRDSFRQQHAQIITDERWIIDGMYRTTFADRLAAADTVIFLDYPRWRCLYGVLKRLWKTRGRVRADMADGCPEKLDWDFLVYVWRFFPAHKPMILDILEKGSSGKSVLKFDTPRALRGWMVKEGLA